MNDDDHVSQGTKVDVRSCRHCCWVLGLRVTSMQSFGNFARESGSDCWPRRPLFVGILVGFRDSWAYL